MRFNLVLDGKVLIKYENGKIIKGPLFLQKHSERLKFRMIIPFLNKINNPKKKRQKITEEIKANTLT